VDTTKKELITVSRRARAGAKRLKPSRGLMSRRTRWPALSPDDLYDVLNHRGTVDVGSGADTPDVAVAAVTRGWATEGGARFAHA
jgi:hypothetical protein